MIDFDVQYHTFFHFSLPLLCWYFKQMLSLSLGTAISMIQSQWFSDSISLPSCFKYTTERIQIAHLRSIIYSCISRNTGPSRVGMATEDPPFSPRPFPKKTDHCRLEIHLPPLFFFFFFRSTLCFIYKLRLFMPSSPSTWSLIT